MEAWPDVTEFVEPEKPKKKSNKKGIIPNINPDNGGGGGDMPNGGGSGGNLPKQ